MAQQVTLGGERIGSGNKIKETLHDYEMTSFNLEQDFKSSMAPGVLYPFLRLVATNHGTFDIDLDSFIRTLPTQGPLFGSFKFQVDIYAVPFRLYQGLLHNNPVSLGMKMGQVYLPKLAVSTIDGKTAPKPAHSNWYTEQINESALLKYNGLSGLGHIANYNFTTKQITRLFQCIPELAYYDIFKNYYANKQEEYAYVITPNEIVKRTYSNEIQDIAIKKVNSQNFYIIDPVNDGHTLTLELGTGDTLAAGDILGTAQLYPINSSHNLRYTFKDEDEQNIIEAVTLGELIDGGYVRNVANALVNGNLQGNNKVTLEILSLLEGAKYIEIETEELTAPQVITDIALSKFKLENIDDMRYAILAANTIGQEFRIGKGETYDWNEGSGVDQTGLPYSALFNTTEDGITWNAFAQNGLVVKTYQSDLFNNWLDTEYIDGENGISAISSVAVVGNKFTMDSLNLAEKIYEYLNRVLISGGTYEDWQEATYGEGAIRKAETPMYVGGMSSEVMFEEVIATTENSNADQALGSLGGKGTQVGKKGGNNIHIKCDEPSYIIGICSLTPRICYSQGNDWDRTELDTLDDLHKPALDGIGFQDMIVEQFAWWDTVIDVTGTGVFHRSSAGKQIAWINYQTAVDKCYGDFAKQDGYAFMVLNRNYEKGNGPSDVKDITTYIDPSKFNYAFAYSDLAAQNFWVQIHSKVTARRKMAGKQIPNL